MRVSKLKLLGSIGVSLAVLICGTMFWGKAKALSDPGFDMATIRHYSKIQGALSHGIFKFEFKRPGLETSVEGIKLTPEFGLTAWMSLSGTREHALLLGDLPLRQEEVAPVLLAILDQGLTPTSLHNRFTMDSSQIMSLHFEGSGSEKLMARAMGWIYSTMNGLKAASAKTKSIHLDVAHSSLDQKTMEKLLWKGEMSNGVFRVDLPRATTLMNQSLGESTGASSWAVFAGNSKTVAVNGEVASIEDELPFVLKDLFEADIQITSIHTHMTQESPKLVFVHFFGVGSVEPLTIAVKEAIWEKEHFQSQ
jgi:hypothetical protein